MQLGFQLTRLLTSVTHCITMVSLSSPRVTCLVTTSQLLPVQLFLTLDSSSATMPYPIIVCMSQLLLGFLVSSTSMERRILLISSASMEAFCRYGLSLNPCCFGMVTCLAALILSQPNSPSPSRISIAANCILCMAKGSSTRIMVLQSSDCCWYHAYCVVLICMFLGMNSERKMKCFEMLAWYFTRLQGFGRVPTTTSFFPLRYKWYCWLWQNVTLWLPLQDTAWKVTFSKLVMTSG